MASRCRVVAFGNRGTGRSGKPKDGYDFAQQAADIASLLDSIGLAKPHLLGFSMGGAIAQEFVTRNPGRVERLVLFGTFCGGVWAQPAPWSVLRRLFVTEGMTAEQAARQAWPVTYSPDYLANHAAEVEAQMHRELEHSTSAHVAQQQMKALQEFDRYRDLKRIAAPTLVAAGTEDLLVKPANSRLIARHIPGARLEMLDGLGHRAIWEAPEEMAELIGDFLTGPRATR